MRTKTEISATLKDIDREEVLNLTENEPGRGYIYQGRNRLWCDHVSGKLCVIKRFKSSLKTRVIYAVRSSKAHRSFLYAAYLRNHGISSPAPVAYIEHRGAFHQLLDCWYVCEYEETKSLGNILESHPEVLKDFARFAARLHEKGIFHGDLNLTNVRIKLVEHSDGSVTPEFSLIDLNRLRYKKSGKALTFKQSISDFSHFTEESDQRFRDCLKEYLKVRNMSQRFDEAVKLKDRHDKCIRMRRSLKKKLFS